METNEFFPTSVLYKDQGIEVRGDEFSLSFNLENGFLEKYNYRNNEVIKNSLKPFFWRAPTDNDLGNGMPERCDIWRNAHDELIMQSLDTSVIENIKIVNAKYFHEKSGSSIELNYKIYGNGILKIKQTHFTPLVLKTLSFQGLG